MPKHNYSYKAFSTYCLRTPLLSLHQFLKFTNSKEISKDSILDVFKNPILSEAIFIASPALYKELVKWKEGTLEASKVDKVSNSLLKYLSRITSRSTPFGLFAGCAAGTLGENTIIEPSQLLKHKRHTRLDMHYLVNLTDELSKNKEIRKQLKWYTNTSLYEAGVHYRYVEYTYINKVRNHSIEAISRSDYINSIIELATLGKTIQELALTLVDDEITLEEATAFIEELIENQILVSELEPSITGGNYLSKLITSLRKVKGAELQVNQLEKLFKELEKLDTIIGNPIEGYTKAFEVINEIGVTGNPKYIFQTDLFLEAKRNQLNIQVVSDLRKGMEILNKITFPNKNNHLKKFKEAFIKRYEEREVPLAQVLDNEMGIGYLQNQYANGSDPLLDDLILPEDPTLKNQKLLWNPLMDVLSKKLQQLEKGQVLELTDADCKDFKSNWDDLPNTMASIIELVNLNGQQQIVVNSFGGSSAGNLLGRFCYGDSKINDLVNEIAEKEKELTPNTIHAEIIHLPESRTGNVLRRPVLHDYEIPYLGASKLPLDQQIPISDLMISLKKGKIYLKSKKHQKQVIPHLTNAHNYSNKALPIYHFLCDLQTQGIRKSIYFDWGALADQNNWLPRVTYQNLIFSKAQWCFKKEEWVEFNKLVANPDLLLKKVESWRKKYKLPQFVQLVEGDNTLLVNLNNTTSFQMLLQSVKNKENTILEEFLFAEEAVVKNEDGGFTNEIVVAFYKEKEQ